MAINLLVFSQAALENKTFSFYHPTPESVPKRLSFESEANQSPDRRITGDPLKLLKWGSFKNKTWPKLEHLMEMWDYRR